MIKIVGLMLLVIAALAVFGRARLGLRLPGRERRKQIASRRCKRCGRPEIGRGGCDCGRSG